MMNALKPVEIDPRDRPLLEKIGRLRVLAWSTEMPDAPERSACWLDDFELAARHWCIFHEGDPVAAARMSVHQRIAEVPDAGVYEGVFAEPPAEPIASFNRLVVHPRRRGRGLSRKLDEVRLKTAANLGCRSAILETHSPNRLDCLRPLGFRVVGPAQSYPGHHFLNKTGIIVHCDLTATWSGIRPTTNCMGWSGDAVNEVSQEFIRYAGECGQPVLDIGAAYGVATIPALEAGATVIANDLSLEHLAELHRRTLPELIPRLTTLPGRFPGDLDFPADSLAAVHASQVLHFLNPEEVMAGLSLAFRWLRPGGRLFVLAATPHQATHAQYAPEFAKRKARGDPWPGVIENLRAWNTHWSAELNPPWLHVFDYEVLCAAVSRAGFVVEWARMFSRTGLPDFCRLDGRENLGLIARKPMPGENGCAPQPSRPGLGI
jgi:SAM-dependent methyltransferase/GNAT superfamily N-acetyltransferase